MIVIFIHSLFNRLCVFSELCWTEFLKTLDFPFENSDMHILRFDKFSVGIRKISNLRLKTGYLSILRRTELL